MRPVVREPAVWNDLAHVLFNVKELVFVKRHRNLLEMVSSPPLATRVEWETEGTSDRPVYPRAEAMAKKTKRNGDLKIERPKRAKITREQAIKFMEDFPKRREAFIAAIRKNKS